VGTGTQLLNNDLIIDPMGEEKIGNPSACSPHDHKHQQAKENEVFRKKKPLRGHSDQRIKSVGDSWSLDAIQK
jgi:hypothetical protein